VNAAFGTAALRANTTGFYNAAFGRAALATNTTGLFNTGIGQYALLNNSTGNFNTAVGQKSMNSNTTGYGNAVLGQGALFYNTIGRNNVALGRYAGINKVAGNNNVFIANAGPAASSHGQIRIGTTGTHTTAVFAGIHGTVSSGGATVLVNASGQLGTVPSSSRFKEDVHDMAAASDVLMELRPVTFHYKKEMAPDSADALQYGLIAEEVAAVAPDLVAPDLAGRPYTVRYDLLPALLLNELQEQQRTIDALKLEVGALRERDGTQEEMCGPSGPAR
jgi:hypothetical protein